MKSIIEARNHFGTQLPPREFIKLGRIKPSVPGVLLLVNSFNAFKHSFVEMGFSHANLSSCESGVMLSGLKKGECTNFPASTFFDV